MTEAVTETNAEPTSAEEQGNPAPEDALGEAGKLALDRMKAERNEAAKRAKALEAKLQQFEDRDKTEAQKLTERAEGAETRAAATETRLDRLEVILEKIPDDATMADARKLVALSKRLVGSNREELSADADELLATFTFKTAPAEESAATPSLDLGTRGATPVALNGDPLLKDLKASLGIT